MAAEDIYMASPSGPSHRMPTISASQALQTLQAPGSRAVSTGLWQLDRMLSPPGLPGQTLSGGYMRGKITEIFGPPGVGKTAFGIQAAASALRDGHHAIWIDGACTPLVPDRLTEVLRSLDNFHYYAVPTLAHLLALFVRPPAAFPPSNTSLIVIDSLSTLFDNAYPRNADDRPKSDQARWAAGRRFAVMNELISTLTRLAALHDIALLVTCQTITRIRGGERALLVPAISGVEWENGISTRMVLFRDWIAGQGKQTKADTATLHKARFAGIVKANGVTLASEGGVGKVVPFVVDATGLSEIDIAAVDIAALTESSLARPLKRSFAEMDEKEGEGVNGPDSDELYGWEDDEVAAEGLLVQDSDLAFDPDAAESRATPSRINYAAEPPQ